MAAAGEQRYVLGGRYPVVRDDSKATGFRYGPLSRHAPNTAVPAGDIASLGAPTLATEADRHLFEAEEPSPRRRGRAALGTCLIARRCGGRGTSNTSSTSPPPRFPGDGYAPGEMPSDDDDEEEEERRRRRRREDGGRSVRRVAAPAAAALGEAAEGDVDAARRKLEEDAKRALKLARDTRAAMIAALGDAVMPEWLRRRRGRTWCAVEPVPGRVDVYKPIWDVDDGRARFVRLRPRCALPGQLRGSAGAADQYIAALSGHDSDDDDDE